MSIMIGDKEPSAIKVGTRDVKAVYAGAEMVWPVVIPIPDVPNHSYAGRVIHSFGEPFNGVGQIYTERGPASSGCNLRQGDVHIMVSAHTGGTDPYAGSWDFGFALQSHVFKGKTTYFSDSIKLNVGIHASETSVTAATHYLSDRATPSVYPQDFLAYAWVIPYEALGSPEDNGDLVFVEASLTKPIEIFDGIPYGVAIVAAGAADVGNADYEGLTHKQSGRSKGNRYSLAGGYKYVRLNSDGQYFEESDVEAVGTAAERLFVYRRRA